MPHLHDDEEGFHAAPRYDLATFSDGALYSSVDDLSRYLAAIVGGEGSIDGATVLTAASAQALIAPAELEVDDGFVDGQGIFWEHYLGLIGHTGGDPGVATAIGYDPETEVGYVVLLNSTGPGTDLLMLQVLESLKTYAASPE